MSTELTMDEVIDELKHRLMLNVEKSQEYTGGMDDSGSMYRTSVTVQLLLDGGVISEVYL